jgi:hypothetical protein
MASLGYWRALIAFPPVDGSVVALERELSRGTLESSTESMTMADKVHTCAALLQKIHNDLRVQHPEWIQPNGECPTCDSYEARLMELLDLSIQGAADETTTVPDCLLERSGNQIQTITKAN